MKEFVNTEKYGRFYIDKVLFESYFPIIFTCKNGNGELFICVCCQNNEKGCKWLVGRTNAVNIVKMLKDEITVRELLLKYSSGKISVDYVDGQYAVAYNNSDWKEDSIYLPKQDSYMFAEEGGFDDEIAYFLSAECLQYDADSYTSTLSETIREGTELATEVPSEFISAPGNIVIPSEVIRTREVVGKVK